MTTTPKSNCCSAPLKVSTADEGTSCYICTKCEKPADVENAKCICGFEPRNGHGLTCPLNNRNEDPSDQLPEHDSSKCFSCMSVVTNGVCPIKNPPNGTRFTLEAPGDQLGHFGDSKKCIGRVCPVNVDGKFIHAEDCPMKDGASLPDQRTSSPQQSPVMTWEETFLAKFGSIHKDRPMPSDLDTEKKITDFISTLLQSSYEQGRQEERESILEKLSEAIIGCAWVDLEDGRGKFVNQNQLSNNILSSLSSKEK